MATNSEMCFEVKKKLFVRSHLKLLLDSLNFALDYDLPAIYLEAAEFPLKAVGEDLTFLRTSIRLKNNSIYIGETQDNIPNGLGYLIDQKGNYYEGYFKDSKFHGKGRLFNSKGFIYAGDWENGDLPLGKILNFTYKTYEGELKNFEPSGNGCEISDEYVYKGEFFRGKKNGKGKVQWNNNTSYEGDFIMGRIEGKGTHYWADSQYTGNWKANKMHGLGVYTWADGRKYEGSMVLGQKEGYGVLTDGGKVYSGYWKAGKEDGKGKVEKNGEVFEGIWQNGTLVSDPVVVIEKGAENKELLIETVEIPESISKIYKKILEVREKLPNFQYSSNSPWKLPSESWKSIGKILYFGEYDSIGKPSGRGIYITKSELYEGQFSNGERSGFGRNIKSNGEVYIGEWERGKRSGFGSFNNGTNVYVGQWEDNSFNGHGKITGPNFVYDGEWVQGLQHGQGTMENRDGSVYSGDFQNGVITGYGTIKYKNCENSGNNFRKCVFGVWESGKLRKLVQKSIEKQESDNEDSLDNETLQLLKSLII